MPELPEVEAIRLGLIKNILDQKIEECTIINPILIAGTSTNRKINPTLKKQFEHSCQNQKIVQIERRAKNLIIHLSNHSLIFIHLKMTGQLIYQDFNTQHTPAFPNKHTHIIFKLNKGFLFYNDIRKFGYVLFYKNEKLFNNAGHFKNLGVEPMTSSFTLNQFSVAIQNSKAPIKTVLLSQKIVVGCGNIYCDEICFASKVLPFKKSNQLQKSEIKLLFNNINQILLKAIKFNGSSINNYTLTDGSKGGFIQFLKVYGKYGSPCPKCNHTILRTIIAGRTTSYCAICQH